MNDQFFYSLVMVLSVFLASISQILLKKSAEKEYPSKLNEYLNPYVLVGYALFFTCTMVNILALRHIPLSYAPILESSGYIFVTILGAIFLKEKVTKRKLTGMVFILIGIAIFAQ